MHETNKQNTVRLVNKHEQTHNTEGFGQKASRKPRGSLEEASRSLEEASRKRHPPLEEGLEPRGRLEEGLEEGSRNI